MGLPLPAPTFARERQTTTGFPPGGVTVAVALGCVISILRGTLLY